MISSQQQQLQPPQQSLPSQVQETKDNFKVYVRIRPLNQKEEQLCQQNIKKRQHIVKAQENMIFVFDPDDLQPGSAPTSQQQLQMQSQGQVYKGEKQYQFDDIFQEHCKTIDVFQHAVQPAVQNLFNGFNSTVFAYGMTGAGKSHTMFGDLQHPDTQDNEAGLVLLVAREFFKQQQQDETECDFTLRFSYIEIYNEQVRDLLSQQPSQSKGTNTSCDAAHLMLVEDPIKGVIVPDLSEQEITDEQQLLQLVLQGNQRRVMASTSFNQFSSRSHAIIQLTMEKSMKKKNSDLQNEVLCSKLCLVDLAGSERAAVSDNKGQRMVEGANINKSLLALGNCINILSDPNKKGSFVPYRDSKLTRLLKDSLGGNTQTIMIACISPSYAAYEETVNTLKYANRARNIKKKVVQNVKEVQAHISEYKDIIENLKIQIIELKDQLKMKDQELAQMGFETNRVGANNVNVAGHSSLHYNQQQQGSLTCSETLVSSATPKQLGSSQSCGEVNQNQDEFTKIFLNNLEENWEIQQTLSELDKLDQQNQGDLQSCDEESVQREEIEKIIKQNDIIKREMLINLNRNMEEKKKLQAQFKQFASQGQGNINSDLELTCKMLKLEKINLCTQNLEIKKHNIELLKQRDEQNQTISDMQKRINSIQKELDQKNKINKQNKELISELLKRNQGTGGSGAGLSQNHGQSNQQNPSMHPQRKSNSIISYSNHQQQQLQQLQQQQTQQQQNNNHQQHYSTSESNTTINAVPHQSVPQQQQKSYRQLGQQQPQPQQQGSDQKKPQKKFYFKIPEKFLKEGTKTSNNVSSNLTNITQNPSTIYQNMIERKNSHHQISSVPTEESQSFFNKIIQNIQIESINQQNNQRKNEISKTSNQIAEDQATTAIAAATKVLQYQQVQPNFCGGGSSVSLVPTPSKKEIDDLKNYAEKINHLDFTKVQNHVNNQNATVLNKEKRSQSRYATHKTGNQQGQIGPKIMRKRESFAENNNNGSLVFDQIDIIQQQSNSSSNVGPSQNSINFKGKINGQTGCNNFSNSNINITQPSNQNFKGNNTLQQSCDNYNSIGSNYSDMIPTNQLPPTCIQRVPQIQTLDPSLTAALNEEQITEQILNFEKSQRCNASSKSPLNNQKLGDNDFLTDDQQKLLQQKQQLLLTSLGQVLPSSSSAMLDLVVSPQYIQNLSNLSKTKNSIKSLHQPPQQQQSDRFDIKSLGSVREKLRNFKNTMQYLYDIMITKQNQCKPSINNQGNVANANQTEEIKSLNQLIEAFQREQFKLNQADQEKMQQLIAFSKLNFPQIEEEETENPANGSNYSSVMTVDIEDLNAFKFQQQQRQSNKENDRNIIGSNNNIKSQPAINQKKNSNPCLVQGLFSNLSSNYAETVNRAINNTGGPQTTGSSNGAISTNCSNVNNRINQKKESFNDQPGSKHCKSKSPNQQNVSRGQQKKGSYVRQKSQDTKNPILKEFSTNLLVVTEEGESTQLII